ncbi:MAG: HesA/MoeB/ThiF family protein [Candidatus Bathyarchaeia archaeon]|nr:HesA/MoeB/ThiF family protein [Candidatus Bathyarchaeota archaeon]
MEMYERYIRQIVLRGFGLEGQEKLRKTIVCVLGLGGLGSIVSLYLAGMGVGRLRIVDSDIVEEVNLHRQILYDMDDLGKPKAYAAMDKLHRLNPEVEVEALVCHVDEQTIDRVIDGVDIVLDGLDNFETRRIVNRACFRYSIPYVYASVIETYGSIAVFKPGESGCFECIFRGVSDEDLPRCERVGVLPAAVGVIASIEVVEAIKLILGWSPNLVGKMAFIDLYSLTFNVFDISRNPECSVCGRGVT